MGVRSTNKANYGPRWESLNTYFHNGHMGEFFNTQMRAGKGTEPVTGPFDTTGGTKFTYGGKTIHAFTSPGTMTCSGQGSAVMTYAMVAGGGGGGHGGSSQGGGGGGAGGYLTGDTPQAIVGGDTSFPVVIGSGGNGGSWPAPSGRGSFGTDSWIAFPTGTVQASGGGFGGGEPAGYRAAGSGGCSGGACGPNNNTGVNSNVWNPLSPNFPGPVGSPNQGNGGAGAPSGGGAGGGGIGGGGGYNDGGPNGGGNGGAGLQLPTVFRDPTNPYGNPGPNGEDFWLGGGGGGAAQSGSGGMGGGPGGGSSTPYAGGGNANQPGAANCGGGGGGRMNPGGTAGAGGSGLVLIAYTPA